MFDTRSAEVVELELQLVGGPPRKGSDLARWLARLSEFDKAQGWFGFRSCARWLAARCSMTVREARGYVRVARKLEELPRVERALFAGRLSYAKVAMVCRVATAHSEKHVLRVALSLRTDDFALVIAEVEATRRRRMVVDYDPDGAEPNGRAESGGSPRGAETRLRPAGDGTCWRITSRGGVSGRSPPAMPSDRVATFVVVASTPPCWAERFNAFGNPRSGPDSPTIGTDTHPSSRSVRSSTRWVTEPDPSGDRNRKRFNRAA